MKRMDGGNIKKGDQNADLRLVRCWVIRGLGVSSRGHGPGGPAVGCLRSTLSPHPTPTTPALRFIPCKSEQLVEIDSFALSEV